jgi:hypothetical protein
MEPQNESIAGKITTRSVGMRYGLFLGGIGIVSFLIMALSGMRPDGPGRWISTVFTFVLIFLAHKYYKDNGDGFMTIGQGVGIGFWAGLVSSVISSIFMYIYLKFVDSGFVDMIKETQMEEMQKRGMSEDQIDQAMKIAGMFTSAEALLIFGLVFGVIFGIGIGLLISFFTQKKNPDAIPM